MTDHTLSFTEYGDPDGRPLLALHGHANSRAQWMRMATEGLPDRRWLCPDLRGHGDSPWTPPWGTAQHALDALATLDALGVGRVDVIGSSFGARVAAEICGLAPSRVGSAVLLDPPLMTPEEYHNRMREEPLLREFVTREYEQLEDVVARHRNEIPDSAWPHVVREVTAFVEPTGTGRLRVRASAEMSAAVRDEIGQRPDLSFGDFRGRVLLLFGTGETAAVTKEGRRSLESELGGRLTCVPIKSGHALMWSKFDDTASEIAQFLDEADREEG